MATVTAGNTTTISSSAKKKIIWIWQSNSHLWNENEQEEWKHYSDFEILVIEGAYAQKRDNVELEDYIINFEHMLKVNKVDYITNFKGMLEVSKVDRSKQRRVKRQETEISQDLREERFCFAENPVKSFTTSGGVWSEFIAEWMKKNEAIIEEKKEQWSEIVKQAAQGIFKESKSLNKEFEGQLISNELMKAKDKESHTIFECCVQLYSCG
ncbi:unnamed protein product [Rotaria socialis]|uniref:WWE domain-containing protein n=1 Tax=Rotaria socialis TaxID=392032 RepID=A0A821GNC1_9BILA|nr:unnamed protein product [Rotaria socialis]CAF4671125.1 unnamed protein product [Rotaria socialis]